MKCSIILRLVLWFVSPSVKGSIILCNFNKFVLGLPNYLCFGIDDVFLSWIILPSIKEGGGFLFLSFFWVCVKRGSFFCLGYHQPSGSSLSSESID